MTPTSYCAQKSIITNASCWYFLFDHYTLTFKVVFSFFFQGYPVRYKKKSNQIQNNKRSTENSQALRKINTLILKKKRQ